MRVVLHELKQAAGRMSIKEMTFKTGTYCAAVTEKVVDSGCRDFEGRFDRYTASAELHKILEGTYPDEDKWEAETNPITAECRSAVRQLTVCDKQTNDRGTAHSCSSCDSLS